MNSLRLIQSLYLQWHRHRGVCSIEQIRSACSNLMMTFGLESKSSLFKVFFPIVRRGLIEFCGDGKFQLSHPSVLYYSKVNIAVGVNLYPEHKDKLDDIKTIVEDEFGIVRFEISRKSIKEFCDSNQIIYTEPDIEEVLSNFPKISNVVEKFDRGLISSHGEYYDILNFRWVSLKSNEFGVFRAAENVSLFYLRTAKMDYEIPTLNENPDGRPLAESYQASQENIDFLFYSEHEKSLKIERVNIPILIERVLRVATLFTVNGVVENFGETLYSNISLSAIKQLNRIFETKAIIKP